MKYPKTAAIAALRAAAPYIRLYRGKTFVIKTSAGAAVDAAIMGRLIEQIAILHYLGIRVVLVHGGAPGVERPQMRELLGSSVLEACRELGVDVAGPPPGVIGMDTLRAQLDAGRMPVLSPQLQAGLGTEQHVDADAFAATIAGRLGAEKLIICTSVPGILEWKDDPATLVSYTDIAGLRALERAGALLGDAIPSAAAIRAALKGGVCRVHIISHDSLDSILIEVFTNEGGGTLIVADVKALTPAEMQPLAVAS